MIAEEKRFLDLDHVCDQILSQQDRDMFNEAIRCYQIGSHRAAVILAWCVTAARLEQRIEELASDGDGTAKDAHVVLENVKGTAVFEQNLLDQARQCELIDDYELKCLTFARDTRSKCAHPTGVLPSAEAVRNILHICSQMVLCREAYRGMTFVKYFVQTKLDDKYLFSDKNRISDTCKYYVGKVPDRLRPQFAACCAEHVINGVSQHWKTNAVQFLSELMGNSDPDLAVKTARKLRPIESSDKPFFSVLVGIDQREGVWDSNDRSQAKAHIRDKLTSGKIDFIEFQSYANLCSIVDFTEEDKALIKARFSALSELIAQHTLLQENRRTELLAMIIDAAKDEDLKQQVLKGVTSLISAELFSQPVDEVGQFVEYLIESDWREESLSELFLMCSDWSNSLKAFLLKSSEKFLLECSEDFPDDILVLFDAANSLLSMNPSMLPAEFEDVTKELVSGDTTMSWFDEQGDAWRTFIGQTDLIRSKHGAHLPTISSLTLPSLEPEELGEDDEEV